MTCPVVMGPENVATDLKVARWTAAFPVDDNPLAPSLAPPVPNITATSSPATAPAVLVERTLMTLVALASDISPPGALCPGLYRYPSIHVSLSLAGRDRSDR